MNTTTDTRTAALESRVLAEGYGTGAWHGPDLKAALADVTPATAFRRPAPGRHNIAEIAVHHAWYLRSVRSQLTGVAASPFVLTGEDWFEIPDERVLAWTKIAALVEDEYRQLAAAVTTSSLVAEADRFNLILGITCHAVYHAGQVQLIKKLTGA